MEHCETCKWWKRQKYQTPSKEWWGTCEYIKDQDDSQSHIVVYGNLRDGEWLGVEVDTKSDFGCVLHVPKA